MALAGLAASAFLIVLAAPTMAGPVAAVKDKVTFVETGLPSGSQWRVSMNGAARDSHTDTISFVIAAGTYAFTVLHRPGYHASPASGTVVVTGSSSIPVTFDSNGASSTISSNFNAAAIPAGDYLWFSSVFTPTAPIPAAGLSLHVTEGRITFTFANGTTSVWSVPDATVSMTPNVTQATTVFSAAAGRWITTAPSSYTGDTFLAGLALQVPAGGLPGGLKGVNWTADFGFYTSSHHQTFSINWQWSAAVYTNFSSDLNALQVKPVSDNSLSEYANSDHAGTPEAFKTYVTGGATGGGGSNFTGSYSATARVSVPQD